jgi:hypothetical protein
MANIATPAGRGVTRGTISGHLRWCGANRPDSGMWWVNRRTGLSTGVTMAELADDFRSGRHGPGQLEATGSSADTRCLNANRQQVG